MLFNSWAFPPFLAVVLALYFGLERRGQNLLLLVASYFFYAWWDWRFLPLLLLSTSVDWTLARFIHAETDRRRARRYVGLSVALNLCFLGVFKYFNFFVGSADALLQGLGLPPLGLSLRVILPLGISFYTFQSISYIVDVYRGQVEPARNPLDFALFVAFFPHMVAGPIMPSRALLPQVQNERHPTRRQWREGAWLMLWGFFKKMAIADNLAPIVDAVYASPQAPGAGAVLVATYAFAFQIYGDFSGYSDIARGAAKLMGFELMLNFDRPYLATGPADFWRRWHVSLSRWLRDYLYVPLGGNRNGALLTYRNLFLTMLLGGLWHGAAWNFVLWGGYHGLLLAGERALFGRGAHPAASRPGRLLARLVTFHLVVYGWLLFRSRSLDQVLSFTRALVTGWGGAGFAPPESVALLVLLVAALWAVDLWIRNADDPATRPLWSYGLGAAACGLLAVGLVLLTPPGTRSFLYFQF